MNMEYVYTYGVIVGESLLIFGFQNYANTD